jgi:hypothetical protein
VGDAAAFVVVAAMLAVSFASYAVSLFVGDHGWGGLRRDDVHRLEPP